MISQQDAGLALKTGKFPCGVCNKGVGSNSIKCTKCSKWVHARCCGIPGKLSKVTDFVCSTCSCQTSTKNTSEHMPEKITIGDSAYDVVNQFCYLGDMLSAGGGAEASSLTRSRCAWKKFRELLPILTSRVLSMKKKGFLYQSCIRSVMLYGSETWPIKEVDVGRLQRTDRSMMRWMAGVRLQDRKSSAELLSRFDLPPIRNVIQSRRLRWFGHVERMDNNNWVQRCMQLQVEGQRSKGRLGNR